MTKKRDTVAVPPMADLPPEEEIDVLSLLQSYLDGEIDLICVIGPTASGKTRYAVSICKEMDKILRPSGRHCEILSADSRQVYIGMDIGTGKDLGEYSGVPYHLMNIAAAGSKYNIFEYQRDFEREYKNIVDAGNVPVLCGGSGLYVEAATCGYSLPDVPQNPQLRAELEKESDEVLIAKLASLQHLHNHTDYDTRKRLIRALEIAIYEHDHPVVRTSYLPKKTFYIGTLVSREERNAKIDKRLDARLDEGLVQEVQGLLDSGIPAEDLIYYGLEYKFVTEYLTGKRSYEEMRRDLAIAIHQFAKRQMTWFRGMERKGIKIHWTKVG